MKTSSIRRSKKYPKFITSHKIFKKFETIEKIFPELGLKNCSMPLSELRTSKAGAEARRERLIRLFSSVSTYYYFDSARAGRIVSLLKKTTPAEFTKQGVVPKALAKEVPISFHKAYFQCRYHPYDRPYYERNNVGFTASTTFSKNAKIVFSSNEKEGVWDIATMSMRGISSCQSWNGSYKRNLVGSMIDPYVGIIYIQDGARCPKGPRMKRRALVRYVVNYTTKKPALLLERTYPHTRNNGYAAEDTETPSIFKSFLEKKTKGAIDIITSPNGYSIPNSKIVKAMSSCGTFENGNDYCRSYRDSGIAYSKRTARYLSKVVA
jgi:hypothetical protein